MRLELALLSHLYTVAIKKRHIGLIYNPVANVRKPPPAKGHDRRLSAEEEKSLLQACNLPAHAWLVL